METIIQKPRQILNVRNSEYARVSYIILAHRLFLIFACKGKKSLLSPEVDIEEVALKYGACESIASCAALTIRIIDLRVETQVYVQSLRVNPDLERKLTAAFPRRFLVVVELENAGVTDSIAKHQRRVM